MIVVSGGLVLVAIVLLVVGLIQDGLGFVYASIGVSVVAAVFLMLGALQRRGEVATPGVAGPAPAPDPLEGLTAVTVTPGDRSAAAAPAAGGGPEVSVVRGRPRYHVASCRFLAGRNDVESIGIEEARAEGFSACGVCRPDEAVAAADVLVTPEPEVEPEEEPVAAPARRTAAAASKPAAKKAAAKAAPAKAAPARTAAKAAAAKPAAKAAPAKAAPAKAASRTAAAAKAAPRSAPTVVVIPDRDKFHTDACRFVKGVPGTMTVSKATAKRQGYTACGICKP